MAIPTTTMHHVLIPQTGEGIVTDVCLKRKIRNYVQLVCGDEAGKRIYIKERAILNKQIDEAYEQPEMDEVEGYDKVHQAREWMCAVLGYTNIWSFDDKRQECRSC